MQEEARQAGAWLLELTAIVEAGEITPAMLAPLRPDIDASWAEQG